MSSIHTINVFVKKNNCQIYNTESKKSNYYQQKLLQSFVFLSKYSHTFIKKISTKKWVAWGSEAFWGTLSNIEIIKRRKLIYLQNADLLRQLFISAINWIIYKISQLDHCVKSTCFWVLFTRTVFPYLFLLKHFM